MDPITIILATLATAVASDQEKKSSEERARSKSTGRDGWATREALEVLGEVWPTTLTPMDWAWMELMEAYGTPVHPWSSQQIEAFRQGRVVCPLNHDMSEGYFRYLDLDLTESKVLPSPQNPDRAVVIDPSQSNRDEAVVHGLVRCTHPDHSHIDKVFWFPFQGFEINYV